MLNKQTAIIIKWLETKATDDDKLEIKNWLNSHPWSTDEHTQHVIDLIKKNQTLNAVKYYKDQVTGDLKTAKEYIDTLKSQLAYDQGADPLRQTVTAGTSQWMTTSDPKRPHLRMDANGIVEQIIQQATLDSNKFYTGNVNKDMLEHLRQKFGK